MSIAKKIILDELIEQSHPNLVETVIYNALYEMHQKNRDTFDGVIAYSICMRIDEAEENGTAEPIMNPEKVNSLLE